MRFLRLYPLVPEPGRRIVKPNKEEFKLGSRTLQPGTAIVEECLYIHRRKDIWGDMLMSSSLNDSPMAP
jgi:hypothetical protein